MAKRRKRKDAKRLQEKEEIDRMRKKLLDFFNSGGSLLFNPETRHAMKTSHENFVTTYMNCSLEIFEDEWKNLSKNYEKYRGEYSGWIIYRSKSAEKTVQRKAYKLRKKRGD